MSGAEWLIFVGVWFLAGIPLGPNAANCMLVASHHGVARALWAVAGILAASIVFQFLVLAGVASLLVTMSAAFTVLKLAGCAYLASMAIRLWRARVDLPGDDDAPAKAGAFALARDGFFISLSNPKAILAYAAVFSQFIDPGAPLAEQIAVLTPTATVVTMAIYIGYCLLGAPLRLFAATASRMRLVNRVVAGFFMTGALAIAANEVRR